MIYSLLLGAVRSSAILTLFLVTSVSSFSNIISINIVNNIDVVNLSNNYMNKKFYVEFLFNLLVLFFVKGYDYNAI